MSDGAEPQEPHEAQEPQEPQLPAEWTKCLSSKHQRYYWFNSATGESRWTPPPAPAPGSNGDGTAARAAKRRRPSEPRVAIIVPFRDLHAEQKRMSHLEAFAPHMDAFLGSRARPHEHRVFIIEQSDDGLKFNRGKLLNVGFEIAASEGYDLFVFHDVDLLPHESLAPCYLDSPGASPLHIAGLWDRYSENPRYCGGIVNFTREQFERINGFPNFFWGWGGEDDEMYNRVVAAGMSFRRPAMPPLPAGQHVIRDLEEMGIDEKMAFLRQHRDWKCMIKRELLAEHEGTWRSNGLSSLRYKVQARVDGFLAPSCSRVTVELGLNGHAMSDGRAAQGRDG